MTVSGTSLNSIPPPVQVQQAAIPPPAEMPFLSVPVHNHDTFHYTRFTRHALLRPIARETGSRIYLQEQPTCGFWYLNHGVIGLHHTLKKRQRAAGPRLPAGRLVWLSGIVWY